VYCPMLKADRRSGLDLTKKASSSASASARTAAAVPAPIRRANENVVAMLIIGGIMAAIVARSTRLAERYTVAERARFKLIATDGVFSMDGIVANLRAICDLAERYGALVMVDDSHAVGFVGDGGRGTPELCGVEGRIDVLTGTLGKALGGASGGYTSGRKDIIELLRQRSRPYLFSNSVAPMIAAATLAVIELLTSTEGVALRRRLRANGDRFRRGMHELGFDLVPGQHPIIPVMLGDAALATRMADALLDEGIYVVGFSYPVVPKGKARIRTQMSAAHTDEQIDRAVAAFAEVGRAQGAVPKRKQEATR